MARQNINIGIVANDGTGDDLRTAMQKVNDNFVEVYSGTLAATTLEFTANNILSTGTNDAIVFVPNGTGTIDFPAIRIDDNNIKGLRSNENLRIIPNGTGGIKLDASTDITGALGVTGLATLGSLKFGSGATITSILDEDTMSSDSATAVPTQQSVKAYVDAQIVSSNSLRVADDSSTVVTIDLDGTLSVIGATGITTSVSGSTLTITGTAQDFAFSSLTGKPTTIAGYGIIDAFDGAFSSLTSKPTTLSGYGITDAVTTGSTAVTVVGDDSTGTAVSVGETFKISGGTGITTAVTGDTLTVTNSANSFSSVVTDSGTESASGITDTLNITGGFGITTQVTGGNVVIHRNVDTYELTTSGGTTNIDLTTGSYNHIKISLSGDTVLNITSLYEGLYHGLVQNTDASSHTLELQVAGSSIGTITLLAFGATPTGSQPYITAAPDVGFIISASDTPDTFWVQAFPLA
jgi:hypothetical protein